MDKLPLKEKQMNCGQEIRSLHRLVLRSFVMQGKIPFLSEMIEVDGDVDQAAVLKNGMMVFQRSLTSESGRFRSAALCAPRSIDSTAKVQSDGKVKQMAKAMWNSSIPVIAATSQCQYQEYHRPLRRSRRGFPLLCPIFGYKK